MTRVKKYSAHHPTIKKYSAHNPYLAEMCVIFSAKLYLAEIFDTLSWRNLKKKKSLLASLNFHFKPTFADCYLALCAVLSFKQEADGPQHSPELTTVK